MCPVADARIGGALRRIVHTNRDVLEEAGGRLQIDQLRVLCRMPSHDILMTPIRIGHHVTAKLIGSEGRVQNVGDPNQWTAVNCPGQAAARERNRQAARASGLHFD